MVQLKIKKLHPNAVVPKRAHPTDAGMDLTVATTEVLPTGQLRVGFGFAAEIPPGYAGFIFPRSSIYKTHYRLSNAVGIVDQAYRGEWGAIFDSIPGREQYRVGDRCAQLVIMPYPEVEVIEVDELSSEDRGGGFGSTGK